MPKSKPSDNSGKVFTVFILIIAVLLMTMTATSVFYLQKEREERQIVEAQLQKKNLEIVKLTEEIKESKKQNFVLEEKNKEADEKINGLLDELELNEGLREKLKKENAALQEQVDKEVKAHEALKAQMATGLKEADEKIAELETRLKQETAAKDALSRQEQTTSAPVSNAALRYQENLTRQEQAQAVPADQMQIPPIPEYDLPPTISPTPVDLEKIVVIPEELPQGRVISVDTDTEFVIINLGSKSGVELGNVMSVYRGKEYLGDVKVTRVQPEMSAADLIPPFTSRLVRRNDQVVVKK